MGKEHPHIVSAMVSLATVLRQLGRYEEAARMLGDTLALGKKVLGKEHINN